jgi:putative tricarboxylic transport membrane protein
MPYLLNTSTAAPRMHKRLATLALSAALGMGTLSAALAQTWEPTKPIDFVVPAGPGGGADQMARFIQSVVAKNRLANQPINVVNKSGTAGAEGLLDVKADAGNPYKIVITLSNLFTTPLGNTVAFNWRDLTPVSMLALDQFILWVHEDSPHKTAKAFFDALRASPNGTLKMGGTGTKQEDQIITVLLESAAGRKMTYVPYRGGGEVANQLAEKAVDATVNNPIEAEALWRTGKVRPLCVFDGRRLPYTNRVTATQAWADVPTCMSSGIPTQYLMLRGIFMPSGVKPEQVKFYVDLLDRVRATPEWKEFMEKGAFNQTTMTGQPFMDWLGRTEQTHRVLMREAGFLAR